MSVTAEELIKEAEQRYGHSVKLMLSYRERHSLCRNWWAVLDCGPFTFESDQETLEAALYGLEVQMNEPCDFPSRR